VKQSRSQKELLEKATSHYSQNIHLAEEYLAHRGLDLETAREIRLGVVDNPLPGQEQFFGRLAIPYLTPTGPVDIRFRSLGPEEPKYMGMPGTQTRMYNIRALHEAGNFIAVCEGEIDAITLHYKCGVPAVGVPGANSWKPHYNRLLSDFETIYVFADGDQPGSDFAKSLSKEMNNVIVLQMPEAEDVNSMFLLNGADYFREKVSA
jgi:DNA primase